MKEKLEEDEARRNFAKDIERHVITVRKDDGLYRHLRMARPDTNNMSYSVITWPGHLAYCGDMGCFVFSRIEDMFAFFRPDTEVPYINLGYWSEKIEAADRNDGYRKFSPTLFEKAVKEQLEDFIKSYGLDDGSDGGVAAELRERLKDEVLAHSDNEGAAYAAALGFEDHDGDNVFQQFGETNCREYTYRYVWCCMAVVHAIQVYGRWKALQPQEHKPDVTSMVEEITSFIQDTLEANAGEAMTSSMIRGYVRHIINHGLGIKEDPPKDGYPPKCEKCGKDGSAFSIMPVCRHCLCLDCMNPAEIIAGTFVCPVCNNKGDKAR